MQKKKNIDLKFQLKLDEAGFKKQLNTLMQEKEEAERLSLKHIESLKAEK